MLREWRRLEWSFVGEGEKVVIRLLGSAKIQRHLAGYGDHSAELDHISPVVLIIPNAGLGQADRVIRFGVLPGRYHGRTTE